MTVPWPNWTRIGAWRPGWLTAIVAVVAASVVALAAAGAGQFGERGRFSPYIRMASPEEFDSTFQFCRVMFRRGRGGDGSSWSVDYPRADVNLSIRLSELTKIHVGFDAAGEPKNVVVRLTDPELFQCPFIMMTEIGAAFFDEEESAKLRDYLLKGGFLWADDFWGPYAWNYWVNVIGRVLPPGEYPIVELPPDHPLFRTQFLVQKTVPIPSINFWGGPGGSTSERGAMSAVARTMAILDHRGRVMVLMTHNTDFGDSWEREGDDPTYFYQFSVPGYAMGVDVVLYAMTH